MSELKSFQPSHATTFMAFNPTKEKKEINLQQEKKLICEHFFLKKIVIRGSVENRVIIIFKIS